MSFKILSNPNYSMTLFFHTSCGNGVTFDLEPGVINSVFCNREKENKYYIRGKLDKSVESPG